MNEHSITELQNWIGRSEIVKDVISLSTVANMSATIGSSPDELQHGSPLPPCWHWLFFNRGAQSEKLRLDGTYADSDYMPPILLPRRMWVGNKIEINKPLTIGSAARRISIIEEITEKTGLSGRLIFLRERMEITDDNCGNLTDWRTLVFRDGAAKIEHQKKTPTPKIGEWFQSINPDPVLLFRYSALTFNSHRIHYDRDYTQNIEGYQDLLVHAPLTATLLLNLLRQQMPLVEVKELSIRATAPIFIGQSFSINGTPSKEGKSIQLWAIAEDGNLAMTVNILL